jgi:hypothetical protein
MGLGQPQVTKEPHRGERAVAISVMASRLLLNYRARDIPAKGPWSALTLKRHFTGQLAQAQLERSVEPRLRKALQERKAVSSTSSACRFQVLRWRIELM